MLRIGILGAARIAPAAIIRPARRRDDVAIAGVASRNADSAREYAVTHGIPRSYGEYRALLADPEIDLVYNALPPSEHAKWSIAAMQAGKDVLCEKPFALNAVQARQMRRAADTTGRRLIEAFHDRYHPLSAELDRLIDSGRLGEIVAVHGDFSATNPFDPKSLRHVPALGGGALMDLGCYPVHWLRALIREEPTVLSAQAALNPLGADLSTQAELQFPGGTRGSITTTMFADSGLDVTLDITGTRGTVHVHNLVFPSSGHYVHEEIDGITRDWTVGGNSTYDHQLDAIVSGLASGEQLLTEGEDSVANMELIDAIYAAAGISRDFD